MEGYTVEDLRNGLFKMAVDLENMRYSVRVAPPTDAAMTDAERESLVLRIKDAQAVVDDLRAKLFDVARGVGVK